jgi:hypothetical protein
MAEPTTTATAVSWFSGAFLVLLGFGTKFISDWFQDKRTLQRERETRDALRRDQLAERRANFQRQTLLELQEALQDLARATGAANVQDERAFKETGRWQRQLLGEEINQQIFLANRRVLMLTVRVRDQALRDALNRFRNLTNDTEVTNRNATHAELREASNVLFRSAVSSLEPIQERIGELLRSLDEEESELARGP